MGLCVSSRACLKSICEIYDEGFNVADIPDNRSLLGGLKKGSYVKKTEKGSEKEYVLTSEGKRYAHVEGWL